MVDDVLPQGWVRVTIDDVAGKCEQRKPVEGQLFTYVDIGSIDREFKVIRDPQRLDGQDAPSRARKVINAGDVIVSLTRPNLNAVALVGEEYDDQIASTGFEVLKPLGIDSNLLHALVRSSEFVNAISGKVQGALYPAAKAADVRSFTFALPGPHEQKQIATKLDELLAQVDSIKTRLDAIPAILKRFRQSVLAAAVSGRLTEEWRAINGVSDQWGSLSIADLADENRYALAIGPFGSNLKVSDYRDAGHPLVFVRDIRSREFGGVNTKFVTAEKFSELQPHRITGGDLLITKMGDPPGDVAIYPEDRPDAVITADCIKFQPNTDLVSKEFAFFAMQSEGFREQVQAISAGVAQQKVSLKKFRALVLPIPNIEEQAEIAKRLGHYWSVMKRLETLLESARARVSGLSQSILARAFSGELTAEWRDGNPDLINGENSAEALLARIQKQRANTQKPKRSRRGLVGKTEGKKTSMIISILDALKNQGQPLDAQSLLAEAGYAKNASTEDVERFMLDIRACLDDGKIRRERHGDKDVFSLVD